MLKEFIAGLCEHACATIKADLSRQEFGWLLRPQGHITLLALRRATIIVTRARLFAALFAVLTPLWIVIDIATFPPEIWHGLALARVLATLAFGGILFALTRMNGMADAYRALGLLMAVPALFFLYTQAHMAQFVPHGMQQAFVIGYSFLPFVMVAGLSIFPLTMAESVVFAAPTVLVQCVVAVFRPEFDWPIVAAMLWFLLLIVAVSALSGLSQLAFMIVLVRDAIRDRMTGCFSRSSGEELLDLQFMLSNRINAPMSVAFVDLDHFKRVNDEFGHEAGDQVLANAAAQIRGYLRTGDMVVRWGGEEFVLIMPNITAAQACRALDRVRRGGFGQRPDGTAVTASIGVAERQADMAESWKHLVETADARMYEAKQAGRDCIVGCGHAIEPSAVGQR